MDRATCADRTCCPATVPREDPRHLSVCHIGAERVPVRVREDPKRLLLIIRSVEAECTSERDDSVMHIEFGHVPHHQVQVQLLGDVVVGPGRRFEFVDLLERKQWRTVWQSRVQPVAPRWVVVPGRRLFVPRPYTSPKSCRQNSAALRASVVSTTT